MKLLRQTLQACFYLIIISAMSSSAFARQQEPMEFIRVIIELKVKEGHVNNFEKSMMEWKECYLSNGGQTAWNTFKRMDGEGDNYVLTYIKSNWEAFDLKDEAGGACQNLAELVLSPHISISSTYFTRFMPDVSKEGAPDDVSIVRATFFKVKTEGYPAFMENLKTMSEHINTVEGNKRGYWYQYMGGGENAPDFFVSETYAGFAPLDNVKGVWQNIEKEMGKKKKDELYQTFFGPIKDVYSHLYRLAPQLSHGTAGE